MVLYWIVLPIAWVVWHLLWRIEVTGREYLIGDKAGRGYVVAANHISDIDPVFIAISVFSWKRMCIIAKEELFKNRSSAGRWAAWARCPSPAARPTPAR